jgi:hypothetical protein
VEDWDLLQAVNARSVFLSYKVAAIQMMKQGRGGRIIGLFFSHVSFPCAQFQPIFRRVLACRQARYEDDSLLVNPLALLTYYQAIPRVARIALANSL